MRNNPWAINLTLDLQKTKFHHEQLRELEKRLFFPREDEYEVFKDAFDLLVTDRSPEAVSILKRLALSTAPQHNGDSSYGMEGLALIGKGAIPEIMEILLCKEPDSVFDMIDALFNPMGIQDIKYVSLPNVIFLRTELRNHVKWAEVISYVASEKHNARERLKETIHNVIAMGKHTVREGAAIQ